MIQLNNSQILERQSHLANFMNHHKQWACSKRPAQQGRRGFGARSVHGVREDDKGPGTPLADFFNRPQMIQFELAHRTLYLPYVIRHARAS